VRYTKMTSVALVAAAAVSLAPHGARAQASQAADEAAIVQGAAGQYAALEHVLIDS
jgi:hypothetical protein